MTVTRLDPRTALVVIDLQHGIVQGPKAHPTDVVVENSALLAEAFRERGLPVVWVHVVGGAPGRTERALAPSGPRPPHWADLVPATRHQPGDKIVTKRTWGAFSYTDLDQWLRGQGVTQLVLAGISTSAGVESTGRQAHELGYHVTFATDAMTDRDAEAHANSVARIFPRIGETGTTAEILGLLG